MPENRQYTIVFTRRRPAGGIFVPGVTPDAAVHRGRRGHEAAGGRLDHRTERLRDGPAGIDSALERNGLVSKRAGSATGRPWASWRPATTWTDGTHLYCLMLGPRQDRRRHQVPMAHDWNEVGATRAIQ
jgi:hypothetical protein